MKFSKSQITKAGDILIDSKSSIEERNKALQLINEWRTLHFHPVNTFQATLRDRVKRLDIKCELVSQRLKRLKSIVGKLERYPSMHLGRMQDIGGLRAVLENCQSTYQLFDYYKNHSLKHQLIDCKDYISQPKESGYRSIHLIYKIVNPNKSEYDGLLVELQLRSKLQHIWATSVETAGVFLKSSLKSSQGPEEWLNFFKLISSLFAIKENKPVLEAHSHFSTKELIKAASVLSRRLNIIKLLSAFSVTADAIHEGQFKGHYHLLEIDLKERRVRITSFKKDELELASEAYLKLEKKSETGPTEVVLVSSNSIKLLKKAYPSYFLDTSDFIEKVKLIERAGLRN